MVSFLSESIFILEEKSTSKMLCKTSLMKTSAKAVKLRKLRVEHTLCLASKMPASNPEAPCNHS